MTTPDLIAVDFDKTLTNPDQDEWRPAEKQEPNEKMVEAVTDAYHDGKKIIIWTARKWNEASRIAGWLTLHEVPYHGLRCDKGSADRYIDDKTITPEQFTGDVIGTVCSTEPDSGMNEVSHSGSFLITD